MSTVDEFVPLLILEQFLCDADDVSVKQLL